MKKSIFLALATSITVISWAQTKPLAPVKPTVALKKVATKPVATKPTSTTVVFKNAKDSASYDIFLIPDGYHGKVVIEYGVQDGSKEEFEGKWRVYRVPANGHLKTTFTLKGNSIRLSDSKYYYVDKNGKTKTVGADTGNHWLLNSNTSDDRAYYNVSRMSLDHKGLITANQSQSSVIGSSNTKRINAFGVAYDNKAKPNNENKSTAESNSQIIAVNNTVRDQLIAGDVRKNYIFIGATWTQNGATPTGKSYSVKKKQTSPGVAVGTSQLANSTMETYFQYGAGKFNSNDASCFSCHSGSLAPNAAFDLSHIYSQLLEGEILSLHTPN